MPLATFPMMLAVAGIGTALFILAALGLLGGAAGKELVSRRQHALGKKQLGFQERQARGLRGAESAASRMRRLMTQENIAATERSN